MFVQELARDYFMNRLVFCMSVKIFKPPSFLFPIRVFLLILGGFPAHRKSKTSLFIS